MSREINFVERIARRKLGVGEDWRMHGWEIVGESDLIVSGGVPVGEYQRGPRKGRPKWAGKGERVVVTKAEEAAEKSLYERETGNCAECQGSKKTWAGWSRDEGNRYRACGKCGATGVAP